MNHQKREAFVLLAHHADRLGHQIVETNPDEHYDKLLMTTFIGIMHWLHKEHKIYLVVNPIPNVSPLKFAAVVYAPIGETVKTIYQHENPLVYYDWVEAHIEGLKVCLELVEEMKK